MKLVIIDDDPIVSASLKTILELNHAFQVLAVGQDGQEALALYRKHEPDILLMDIRMKHVSGIEAGREILKFFPDARIAYLTTFQDDEYVHEALSIGAKGYLLKQDFETISLALQSILAGQAVFGDEVLRKLAKHHTKKTVDASLNDKDIELIRQIAQGLSNKEIAQVLGYSEGTIRNHISTILEKLSLRDRTQLAIYYFNQLK